MITCTRRLQFCAGHRVVGHENKCRNLHGHNYVVLITATALSLDDVGRVIDFSVLKERIGGWIEEHWDHGLILWSEDPLATLEAPEGLDKVSVLPDNPTAENLAKFLGLDVCPLVLEGTGVRVVEVAIWETENCVATWRSVL